MMSLFSDFDIFIFNYFFFSFFVFLMFILNFFKSFLLNKMKFFYFFVFNFFFSYFFSLSNSKTKFIDFYFLSLFFILFFLNVWSIMSFNFSLTTQMSVCLAVSLMSWGTFFFFELYLNCKKMFFHFIPQGCPISFILFLFLIELVSNLIRPFTLSVRLLANIMTGHLLLSLLSKILFLFPVSFFVFTFLLFLEIMVSIIQSYILVTLSYLYYSDLF